MLSPIRLFAFYLVAMVVMAPASPIAARQQPQQQSQQQLDVPAAPIPPAIFSAKKVFISNAGADSGLFPHPFSGSQERVYNQFYAAMQNWGRYDLVGDPNEGDLVFEIRLSAPNGPTNPDKAKGASDPLPIARLEILDRKSHYVLWTVTESVSIAWFQKSHDRNLDDALSALLVSVQKLAKSAPASTSAAK